MMEGLDEPDDVNSHLESNRNRTRTRKLHFRAIFRHLTRDVSCVLAETSGEPVGVVGENIPLSQ